MLGIKEAFLKCARQQFPVAQIPDGVSPLQLRDMVRTFSMGWSESIIACPVLSNHQKTVLVNQLAQHYLMINSPDFIPDDSWKWWL